MTSFVITPQRFYDVFHTYVPSPQRNKLESQDDSTSLTYSVHSTHLSSTAPGNEIPTGSTAEGIEESVSREQGTAGEETTRLGTRRGG